MRLTSKSVYEALKNVRLKFFVPLYNLRYSSIVKSLQSYPAKTVLDLGCGQGTLLPKIGKYADLLIGLDLFPHGWIKYAKANKGNIRNVELIKSDAFHLPFTEGTFDVVIAADVFEHFQKLPDALQEVDSILKIEGRLIISAPAENFIYKFMRVLYRSQPTYKQSKSEPIGDFHYHKASEIFDFCTDSFMLIDKKMIPFSIPLWLIFEVKKMQKPSIT